MVKGKVFIQRWRRKVQSTLEYAALIAIVVGALIAMQAYVKRGLQGKMKGTADQISGEQFSAEKTTGTTITNVTTNTTENLREGTTKSNTIRNMLSNEDYNTPGLDQENWPT